LQRAYNFAKRHRALGLGVLGWHSYLQHNFLAFDSKEAAQLNYTIFKTIRGKADKASIELGEKFGTVMCTNRRNTTLLAIAPTKTSSFILGQVSQGIEPYTSNYNIEEKAKVKEVFKNPYLDNYLTAIGRNHPMIWESIMLHDGSVQHLDFLSDEAKAVFLTFGEIHHKTILDQAGVRQQFIDQAQSINLAVPDWMTPRQLLDEIYLYAWKIGVKSLYYQYGVNASQALSRKLQQGECTSCHA
jgi:ribonucleoside-diphosphate reductase alpha chain